MMNNDVQINALSYELCCSFLLPLLIQIWAIYLLSHNTSQVHTIPSLTSTSQVDNVCWMYGGWRSHFLQQCPCLFLEMQAVKFDRQKVNLQDTLLTMADQPTTLTRGNSLITDPRFVRGNSIHKLTDSDVCVYLHQLSAIKFLFADITWVAICQWSYTTRTETYRNSRFERGLLDILGWASQWDHLLRVHILGQVCNGIDCCSSTYLAICCSGSTWWGAAMCVRCGTRSHQTHTLDGYIWEPSN